MCIDEILYNNSNLLFLEMKKSVTFFKFLPLISISRFNNKIKFFEKKKYVNISV